jgi:hypothetical protein
MLQRGFEATWHPGIVLFTAAVLLVACGGGANPTPSASPMGSAGGAEFSLQVEPAESVGWTIGGQRVVFLVTPSGSAYEGDVTITAEAPGATVSVAPQPLPPGTVGEVSVVPDPVSEETELTVTITAGRGGVERQESRTLTMAPGEDTLGPEADALLARFTEWLVAERPDLGIVPETEWAGTPGSWVLVVNHRQYMSDDWELGLEWHVMIAPDDWARIYLRHRWTESRPSAAFEISSVSSDDVPHEIDPPASVWR